jgi:1,4-dihydroxy-2-naphthoate octaprenyltransferase
MRKYISYIFHLFSEARDHILILNILFFNNLRQIIPEIRSERRDLLICISILKTTGTFTPLHSAGYLILRNELRSIQEVTRQNIQVSFYIRSTGL